jgi:transposase
VAKAMDYMLKRIEVFTRFLDDGRICLSNNAAERGGGGNCVGAPDFVCGSRRVRAMHLQITETGE